MQSNTTLNPVRIVQTVERLCQRIDERFPGSSLHSIALNLLDIANHTEGESAEIERPIYPLRCLSAGLLLLIAVLLSVAVFLLFKDLWQNQTLNPRALMPVVDTGSNAIVIISVVVFFLLGFERRIKRKKALKAIHRLRAIAHVIDMHQLTKDPSAFDDNYVSTESSPTRTLTTAELVRYLDYCIELLSLTGKLAALYIQRFDDEVTLSAANDIENLTTQLSRKIWQKVIIAYSR